VFSSPIASPGAVAAIPWYLSGGIAAANCIAAYDAKNAASQAASYKNLANPGTYDLTTAKAPSWSAGTGWTNALYGAQYLNTGIYAGQHWTMIVRFSDGTADSKNLCGTVTTPGKWFTISPNYGGSARLYAGGGYIIVFTSKIDTGTMAISGHQGYLNGVADGAPCSDYTGDPEWMLFIGAMSTTNNTLSYGTSFIGSIQAAAIYNISLSSTVIGLLTTAMATL
jgi:hypothetical protein